MRAGQLLDMLTLIFALPLADLRHLGRHTALAVFARARSRAVSMTWHDNTAGDLARDGLALVHAGRVWRLERAQPNGEAWPPATPAPVLAEAARPDLIATQLPPDLALIATFAGRETRRIAADIGAEMRVIRGELRAGGLVEPRVFLTLSGPEAVIVPLASALAETIALTPPLASLSAEAIALAAGTRPPPRRQGSVALSGGQPVGEAFSHIIAHLTDAMLFWTHAIGQPGEDAEAVHQSRVALRRMRSAISIFRDACAAPALRDAGAGLRELGHILGPARDWDVFLAGIGRTIGEAFPEEPALQRLLRAGEQKRAHAYRQLAFYLAGPEMRRLSVALIAIGAGDGWRDGLDDSQRAAAAEPIERFAAAILTRRHRRVRRRGDHFASLDVPALHAVRLAAKRLRYAAEFFAALFDARSAARFIRRLAVLQDELGHLNDAGVANALLGELGAARGSRGYALGLARGFVAGDAAHGRRRLGRAWKRFRKLDPFWD